MRIFAGQDPTCVWVGWVTPDYHYYSNNYHLGKNRTVTVTLGDERGRVHERWGFKIFYRKVFFDAPSVDVVHLFADNWQREEE